MIRKLLPLTFAMILAVTLRLGAGGWAVVTLDTLPESVVVSTPLRLSFTVRQHGQTLMDGLQPRVVAVAGKDQVAGDAQPGGQPGRYVAMLTFPSLSDRQGSPQRPARAERGPFVWCCRRRGVRLLGSPCGPATRRYMTVR